MVRKLESLHVVFLSVIERLATLANDLEKEFKMSVSKMFLGFEMLKHEKVMLLPRMDLIDEALRSLPGFVESDGNGNVKPIEVTLHGFFHYLVNACSRIINGQETGIFRMVIPAFPLTASAHSAKYGRAIVKTLWKHITYMTKLGYVLVPPKVHKSNPMVLEFVRKDTKFGEIIATLSPTNIIKLYKNLVHIGETSHQPLSKMIANVPCKMVNIPDFKLKIEEFDKYVKDITKSKGKGYKETMAWWKKANKIAIKTPRGDGEIFISPKSPIWAIVPELFKGKDESKPKDYEYLTYGDFEFLARIMLDKIMEVYREGDADGRIFFMRFEIRGKYHLDSHF